MLIFPEIEHWVSQQKIIICFVWKFFHSRSPFQRSLCSRHCYSWYLTCHNHLSHLCQSSIVADIVMCLYSPHNKMSSIKKRSQNILLVILFLPLKTTLFIIKCCQASGYFIMSTRVVIPICLKNKTLFYYKLFFFNYQKIILKL